MIGEADADVVMAEVAPRGGLLVGGLVGTEAVLVVEDILELQAQFGFVLENLPSHRAIPQKEVLVHRLHVVASAGALREVGVEDKIANGDLALDTKAVVPQRGILFRRGIVTLTVGIDFCKDRGLQPIAVER